MKDEARGVGKLSHKRLENSLGYYCDGDERLLVPKFKRTILLQSIFSISGSSMAEIENWIEEIAEKDHDYRSKSLSVSLKMLLAVSGTTFVRWLMGIIVFHLLSPAQGLLWVLVPFAACILLKSSKPSSIK